MREGKPLPRLPNKARERVMSKMGMSSGCRGGLPTRAVTLPVQNGANGCNGGREEPGE